MTAPPSSEYSASSLLRSGVAYDASSESGPPETVKSDCDPVVREDSTSRCSVPFVTTAATTGPVGLALIASAICCGVASAATAICIVFVLSLADVIVSVPAVPPGSE